MTLYIDQREKDADLIAAVIAKCEELKEPFEVTTLDVGDFIFDNKICFEHKSTDDFKSSLHNGHMDGQLQDIKQYPVHALIITGRWKYTWDPRNHQYLHHFTPNHKNGKIASYVFGEDWKVPVIQVDNATEFATILFMIRDQVNDLDTMSGLDIVARRHTKTANHEDHNLNLLLAIKGLGLKRARELKNLYPLTGPFIQEYKESGCLQVPKTILTKTARQTLDTLTGTDWSNYKPPKKSRSKKQAT